MPSCDRHKGTDFALPSLACMAKGVAVLAAAPGQVSAVRDGEADGTCMDGADVAGKDCGNGIVIEPGDGWETQYCHLRQGSVAVRPGDTVAAGDRLEIGIIGPDGFRFSHAAELDRTQARYYRFAGRKMPPEGWHPAVTKPALP